MQTVEALYLTWAHHYGCINYPHKKLQVNTELKDPISYNENTRQKNSEITDPLNEGFIWGVYE